ncbi:protein artichoke-like [Sesbania bispinosa]|nr:protein artichoke-like [Sesbania bispinosa]
MRDAVTRRAAAGREIRPWQADQSCSAPRSTYQRHWFTVDEFQTAQYFSCTRCLQKARASGAVSTPPPIPGQ